MALDQLTSHQQKRRTDLGKSAGEWCIDKAAADLHHRLTHIQPGSADQLREGTLECRVSSHSALTWREVFKQYAEQELFEVSEDGRTITRVQPSYEHVPAPAEICAALRAKALSQRFDLSTEDGVLGLITLKVRHELEQQRPDLGKELLDCKAERLGRHILEGLNAHMLTEGERFHLNQHLCEAIVREGYAAIEGAPKCHSDIYDLVRSFMEPLHLSRIHNPGPDSFRNYSPKRAA